MAVLVGIDEAGYGPILGPLVVSSCVFSMPKGLVSRDLWQILRKSISDKRKNLAGRLLITDSKKAYSKSMGIKQLQRTVLACVKSLGAEPDKLTELLTLLCPESLDRLKRYPWYSKASEHYLSANGSDITIAAEVFTDDMAANGIKLLGLKSCCLDVEYYNNIVSKTKNKSTVLFSATSQLIYAVSKKFKDEELHIIIDKQGGRDHYTNHLLRIFPGAQLKILKESGTSSSYELQDGRSIIRLYFAVKADTRFLPVSLASMISKYIRELMVANINNYFASHCSQLKPTAGYWKDGLRFIQDIKENLPHLQIDNNQLIRSR